MLTIADSIPDSIRLARQAAWLDSVGKGGRAEIIRQRFPTELMSQFSTLEQRNPDKAEALFQFAANEIAQLYTPEEVTDLLRRGVDVYSLFLTRRPVAEAAIVSSQAVVIAEFLSANTAASGSDGDNSTVLFHVVKVLKGYLSTDTIRMRERTGRMADGRTLISPGGIIDGRGRTGLNLRIPEPGMQFLLHLVPYDLHVLRSGYTPLTDGYQYFYNMRTIFQFNGSDQLVPFKDDHASTESLSRITALIQKLH
jgi:hypothetical protein